MLSVDFTTRQRVNCGDHFNSTREFGKDTISTIIRALFLLPTDYSNLISSKQIFIRVDYPQISEPRIPIETKLERRGKEPSQSEDESYTLEEGTYIITTTHTPF
jgi:hypothetical protein